MESFTNVTFHEIKIGDKATVKRRLNKTEVEALALVGGDVDAFQITGGRTTRRRKLATKAGGAKPLLPGRLNRKLPGPGPSITAQTPPSEAVARPATGPAPTVR